MVNAVELEDRIDKCKKILSKDPESLIFAALSEAYRRKGDLNMATKTCSQGLKIHPDYGSAHLVMAKINMDKRFFAEAEKELFLAIKVDGRTRANELLLSEILIKKGKSEEAKKLLDKLFATDPENPQVKKLIQDIESQEETEDTEVKWKDIPADYRIFKQLEEKLSPQDALNEILKVPGVVGCLIIDKDGLITEQKFKQELNSEVLGVTSAVVFGEIQKSLPGIDFGSLDQALIESKEINFMVLKLENSLLSIYCDNRTNFGYLNMRLSKVREKISFA